MQKETQGNALAGKDSMSPFVMWAGMVVFVLGALYYVFFHRVTDTVVSDPRAAEAGNMVLGRMNGSKIAVEKAQNYFTSTPASDIYYDDAQLALELALLSSQDQEDRARGIAMVKEEYLDPVTSAEEKVYAIVRLLSFMQYAPESFVNEVFVGEPFSVFKGKTRLESFKNLAEQSLQLKRTSAALLHLGYFYVPNVISKFSKSGVMEVSSESEALRSILDEAKKLHAIESNTFTRTAISYLEDSDFFYNYGFLSGVLSLADKSALFEMTDSFNREYQLYTRAVAETRGDIPAIKTRLPYARLNHALFLAVHDADAYATDITSHLDEVARLEMSDQSRTGSFAVFLKKVGQSSSSQWISQERVKKLVGKSSSFDEYLKSLGWNF